MTLPAFLAGVPRESNLMSKCLRLAKPGGLFLEFGVWTGHSLRYIRARVPRHQTIYGFDSFQGLPEFWKDDCPKGNFATNERPRVHNVVLIEGWFADTLPGFVASHQGPASFIHIDCDLYSSTKTIFDHCADLIVPGTVLMFDEMFGYDGWQEHEHKAFMEFGRRFEIIGHDGVYRVGVRML